MCQHAKSYDGIGSSIPKWIEYGGEREPIQVGRGSVDGLLGHRIFCFFAGILALEVCAPVGNRAPSSHGGVKTPPRGCYSREDVSVLGQRRPLR